MPEQTDYLRWFDDLDSDDVPQGGGKNASLGEMISALKGRGIRVPEGFATTAHAYRTFLAHNELEGEIESLIDDFRGDGSTLEETGEAIRALFMEAEFPGEVAEAVRSAYASLSSHYDDEATDVAARSSATAEDLPEASFAGQQESFLNIAGEEALLEVCKNCYASLFTDRAISYREEKGFEHMQVALSVGVQKMVRADTAGSGVLFTLDTETGFPDVVLINAAWGLGENVVQGTINPDQYTVFKPFLDEEDLCPIIGKERGAKEKKMVYSKGGGGSTENVATSEGERQAFVLGDEEILQLARWEAAIEEHYEQPMDIEWAKDGEPGELFILQARPETVQSQKEDGSMKTYSIKEKGEQLAAGLSIGQAAAAGKVFAIASPDDQDQFEEGGILVTGQTDPDWVPLLKQAAGVVTDHGGRTSHAAIVSRELGIPAVVGTGDATEKLEDGQDVTLSCVEGDEGYVYEGCLESDHPDFAEFLVEAGIDSISLNPDSTLGVIDHVAQQEQQMAAG